MAYIALYRKYRPRVLQDVVGQHAVVQTLVNSLEQKKIHHAYLFCGPRGTGKTSIARAFARSVNCKDGPTPHPCGQCVSCKRNEQGNSLDVVEIDAASNRGIDEIRALKGTVSFSPSEGTYKVYIIDEVHMLTKGAFNAFLKTLEDPPPNVLFILATTEPHQVLPTILSRCQRFDFRLHTHKDIVERLSLICKEEGIDANKQALEAIAQSAEGGLRDAISLLDQAISFSGIKLEEGHVFQLLGKVDRSELQALIEAVFQGQTPRLLELLHEVSRRGKDPQQLLTDMIQYLRGVLLLKECGKDTKLLEISQEDREAMYQAGENIPQSGLISMLEIGAEMEREMKFSNQPYVLLEMLGVRLAGIKGNNVQERLDALEQQVAQLYKGSPESHRPRAEEKKDPRTLLEKQAKRKKEEKEEKEEVSEPEKVRQEKTSQSSAVSEPSSRKKATKPTAETETPKKGTEDLTLSQVEQGWHGFLEYLQELKRKDSKYTRLQALLRDTKPRKLADDRLHILVNFSFHRETLEKEKGLVEAALKEYYKVPLAVNFFLEGEELQTSAKQGETSKEKSLRDHPVVQQALEVFDGTIIED